MATLTPRKASVSFIFITILLDAVGLGLVIPVLPDVIRRFEADPHTVSAWFGWFISIYALMQFLASPLLGLLSDRWGRRPVLLVSLLGAALDYVLMAYAPNLSVLFAGRVLAGLTGASMTVASSYMADISNDQNRAAHFGLIGAGWGAGFVLGPVMGGVLGTWGGPTAPFLGAALLNGLSFMWGFWVLPESLPLDRRRLLTRQALNPFRSLHRFLVQDELLPWMGVYFLLYLAGNSHPSIWTLYTEHKFGWTSAQVGFSLAFTGVCIGVAQGGLTRVLTPRLGEPRSLQLGMAAYVLGFLFFAFAPHGWMMYAIMLIFSVSGLTGPVLQSSLSKKVPANEQGELQGSLMSLGSLTGILGPIIYTQAFGWFTRSTSPVVFPGVAYLLAAFICVVAAMELRRLNWGKAPGETGSPGA